MADIKNTVTVISPDGKLGNIPAEEFLAAKAQGYSLPEEPKVVGPSPSDLSPDGKQVTVVKYDGTVGKIPLEQLEDAQNQGFKLASKDNPQEVAAEHARLFQGHQILNEAGDMHFGEAFKKANESFNKDDIQDKDGNFLFKTPKGEIVPVPPSQLNRVLADRELKFKDDRFQSIVDAKMDNYYEGGHRTSSKGYQQVEGALDTISFGLSHYLRDKDIADRDLEPTLKAQKIADKFLPYAMEDAKRAQETGQKIGLVASLATGGIGNSGKALAQGAGNLIAKEGATLTRQILARAAVGAVEGAILTAPQALIQGAIMKDVKGSAESLGLGIGIGGLLGGGGRLLGAGLEKAGILGGKLAEAKAPGVLSALGASEDTLKAVNAAGIKDEQLVKTLLDHGISGTATPAKMEEGLRKLSSAEHLTSTLSSLDKVGEAIPAEGLLKKISTASEGGQLSLGILRDPNTEKAISSLSTKLAEKAGPKGELTLSNLQKYTAEVGHDINWAVSDNAANNIKKQIYKDATATLLEAGDLAALKSNAKTATAWAEGKVMAKASEEMREQLLKDIADGKLTQKLSPIAQKISDMVTSKASGIAGGAAGAMLGGLPGAIVGGAVGEKVSGAIKGYTDNLAERYLANADNGSKLSGWLTKNKASQAVSSYVAMDALHSVGERVASIAPFVNDLSVKTPVMFASRAEPMAEILGMSGKGLSKQEQYTKLSEQIAKISGNPDLLNQQIQDLTSSVGKNHPELAMQMQQDLTNKVQYLQQVLHGKNNSDVAVPFKKQQDYKPTTSDLKEIEDQLKIAQNPFALMEGLKNGKVTAKQVAAASVLNPAILEQMRAEITKEAYSGKSSLTYQQRLAASTIMGQPMDQSLKMLPQLQAVYGGGQQQGQPGAPPAPQGKAPKMNVSKMPSAQGTMGQRISGK